MQPADPRLRYLYAAWAFLEIAGFGGLVFGWGSLVFVLKREDIFRNLCENGTGSVSNVSIGVYQEDVSNSTSSSSSDQATSPTLQSSGLCDAQDAMLNLVFSVASSFYCLAAFVAGQINYRYGTRFTRLAATTSFSLGSMAIVFTSKEIPWLIFPGTCLISAGGITYFMTNVQISLLFPKAGSLVVGLFIGGFEASAGTAQAIKIGYEHGISLQASFLILCLCQLLTLVSTFIFLPRDFIKKQPDSALLGKLSIKASKSKVSKKVEKLPPLKSLVVSPTYLLHLYWSAVLQFRFMFVLSSLNVTLEKMLPSKQQGEGHRALKLSCFISLLFSDHPSNIILFFFHTAYCNKRNLSPLRRKLMPTVLPLALGTSLGVMMSAAALVERAAIVCLVFLILVIMRAFIYTLLSGLLLAV
ncbi:hypothetical protein EGW08_019739 [Elysia chlorotica]|uniref:Battenin n=1 Tax=Elysia chlorotica TaxID=188477 RepID=A0A3S0ZDJ2_ELYCH|nr:hypothetical protein EGW08_019739 [Elysia chlorotica]